MRKYLNRFSDTQLGAAAAFLLALGFFFYVTPFTYLNTEQATGGDTGSHFYSLWVLLKYGLRAYSPGNLMGEPILLHYFPGPFMVMGFLSIFMPIGMAFNIGTILPVATLPFTAWVALRGLGYRMSTCFLALAALFVVQFHEANSMWGGNANSLLAGQFAHHYALNFLLLAIGALGWELRTGKKYYISAFLLSFVAVSHSYVYMFAPLVMLSFWLFRNEQTGHQRVVYLFKVGVISLLASAWFTIPQIANSSWVTRAPLTWVFARGGLEMIPLELAFLFGSLLLFLPFFAYQAGAKKLELRLLLRETLFWLLPVLGCVGMFFVLPLIGLVDIRVVPQAHVFLALYTVVIIAMAFENWPRRDRWIMTGAVCILFFVLTYREIANYPHWVRWNYSGWQAKDKFKEAQSVFDFLKGDFSQPRIANEHNADLGSTGSPRVFELMPYYARRATMESLYAEATHTAFITTDIQGRISKFPSCPIRNVPCPTLDTNSLVAKMKMIGLRDLILLTPEAIAAVTKSGPFEKVFSTELFKIYRLQEPVSLVDVLSDKPVWIGKSDWQESFRKWYTNYNKSQSPLLAADIESLSPTLFTNETMDIASNCKPQLNVDFNYMELQTDCPGKWHIIKFTYHPAWSTDSGDKLYLISPGFMLISPSQKVVKFHFGSYWIWTLSNLVSIACFLAWLAFFGKSFFARFKSAANP